MESVPGVAFVVLHARFYHGEEGFHASDYLKVS